MGERVEFNGTTKEWFGIWMVNLVLTILTLGIYSAWAKVRTKQYFYRNTKIAGRSFDYHATGKQILIGRIIVVIGFVAYSVLATIPVLAIVLPLLFLGVFPYLLYRSLRFNARVSSWSGVRFNFTGTYGGAFKAYLLIPFLTLFTAYLAWPFAERAQRRYTTNGHVLGRSPLSFDAPIGPFYKAFGLSVLWFLFVICCGLGVILALSIGHSGGTGWDLNDPQGTAELFGGTVFFLSLFFLFFALVTSATLFQAFIRNVVYNNTLLDGRHSFVSTVSPMAILWIVATNGVAVIFSFGLLLPWAQIRLASYFADHTEFVPDGSLDGFISHFEAEKSSIGDAFTDIEGIDFDINL
ncbi:YjgN family protein [Dinoroseobacter sp. S76]|uniref:YjgN family protein n=1 Tax=Dinoroseobacter sp. S76 TaxID=3415124 RepID=UPI003C79C85C